MVIDDTTKACILLEYGSVEKFICKYFNNYYTRDDLVMAYLKRRIELMDDDESSEDEDDQKYEIFEYMACDLTEKLFENDQEMIPYLVRALDKIL